MDIIPEVLLSSKQSLLIWHGGHNAEEIQPLVEGLRKKAVAGEGMVKGSVLLEHAERLLLGKGSDLSCIH